MSDHEFEKQVRQKLDTLKLTPSASSWNRIEDELRAGRRRRTPWLWLSLLVLGLASAGYFLMEEGEGKREMAEGREEKGEGENGKRKREKEAIVIDKSINSLQNIPQRELANNDADADSKQLPHNGIASNKKERIKKDDDRKIVIADVQKQNRERILKGKAAKENDLLNDENVIAQNTKRGNAVAEKKSLPGNAKEPADEIAKETTAPEKVVEEEKPLQDKLDDESKTSSTEKNLAPAIDKKKQSEKGNWSFGVTGYAGLAAVNEGRFLNFTESQVDDVSFTPDFAPSIAYRPSPAPSRIKPGMAFAIGAFAQKELSPRWAISAGLSYLQLNTRSKVGQEGHGNRVVNSGAAGFISVVNYYNVDQDQSTEYKNKYHFIVLPIKAHWKLNSSERLPLQLDMGVSVSRLLRSNSLHFDGTTGVYYQNDRLLNQTQAAVTTGISLSLFNKTKMPLKIGPSVRYNLSKILRKDISTRKNFVSFGVDMRLTLKK